MKSEKKIVVVTKALWTYVVLHCLVNMLGWLLAPVVTKGSQYSCYLNTRSLNTKCINKSLWVTCCYIKRAFLHELKHAALTHLHLGLQCYKGLEWRVKLIGSCGTHSHFLPSFLVTNSSIFLFQVGSVTIILREKIIKNLLSHSWTQSSWMTR